MLPASMDDDLEGGAAEAMKKMEGKQVRGFRIGRVPRMTPPRTSFAHVPMECVFLRVMYPEMPFSLRNVLSHEVIVSGHIHAVGELSERRKMNAWNLLFHVENRTGTTVPCSPSPRERHETPAGEAAGHRGPGPVRHPRDGCRLGSRDEAQQGHPGRQRHRLHQNQSACVRVGMRMGMSDYVRVIYVFSFFSWDLLFIRCCFLFLLYYLPSDKQIQMNPLKVSLNVTMILTHTLVYPLYK